MAISSHYPEFKPTLASFMSMTVYVISDENTHFMQRTWSILGLATESQPV